MHEYRGFPQRTTAGGYLVTKDGQPLDPGPSQKLDNHSPDGFMWGYSIEDDRLVVQSPLSGQFSYEGSRHSNHFAASWDFVQEIDRMIQNGDMYDKETHPQSLSQPSFLWKVSLELDGCIYQYAFSFIGCNKVDKELAAITRKINYIGKAIVGQVYIPSDNFGLSPKRFCLSSIEPSEFGGSPYIALEFKPPLFNGEMLVGSPSGITSRRTIMMYPGPSCPGIEEFRILFRGDLTTEKALDVFCHLILLSFSGDYIIKPPLKSIRSGPAQLALALLLDVTGDPELALRLHHSFKEEMIATIPIDTPWVMLDHTIKAWVNQKQILERIG